MHPHSCMPTVTENVHPRSMDFRNQRKVVVLRTVQNLPWDQVAEAVVARDGGAPSEKQCRRVFKEFNERLGRRPYKYHRCGRKKWKATKEVETFLVRKLLVIRQKCVCTSTTLQRELLQEKGVQLACSTIRKILIKKGYKWLPRSQKPLYSKKDKALRRDFARAVLQKTTAQLDRFFAMAMDGVVLSLPPANKVDRENYCRVGESHMWRKTNEAAKPELSGRDDYTKQIPYARAVPMWGGIGVGGFGLVLYHKFRKVNTDEWVKAVNAGKLTSACRATQAGDSDGPWRVLCDNESFLKTPDSKAAMRRARVSLWHIPPRSPDLNPVEKFWSHLRRWLRALDLADVTAGRPPVMKSALKERVRRVLRSAKAKTTARNTVRSLRKTCQEVLRKGGAATRG